MKKIIILFMVMFLSIAGYSQSGKVEITVNFEHAGGIASNQFAVWIEDSQGKYIKTLFVTRFTNKGGFKSRPEALPLWRKVSNRDQRTDEYIDSVTGATPYNAKETKLTWNLTDETGKAVKPGIYIYKAESNLFWQERSVFTGKISIDGKSVSSEAAAEYFPPDTGKKSIGVVKLAASYIP